MFGEFFRLQKNSMLRLKYAGERFVFQEKSSSQKSELKSARNLNPILMGQLWR